ncbi:predicted protein [Pyrenophora tritici-repentis Pt-1C-BFP]|uniref:Uncharacterized protein n=1 Tax=Pyrenophora tritici-repentis (strain Pt-1C-BFP) TaxID=426418 RepID=B2WC49_PYRTR|nr:uncharacterized protein PTRG_07558 [Pyrenophora tritici-repentis Pt-1C-BFP]EDU50477.1 predicted protein [Pyrenophora tritici-repentis Pt-1C-BFP]
MTTIAHYAAIARHTSRFKELFHTFVQGRHDLFGRSEALDGMSSLHIARCTNTEYWRAELGWQWQWKWKWQMCFRRGLHQKMGDTRYR